MRLSYCCLTASVSLHADSGRSSRPPPCTLGSWGQSLPSQPWRHWLVHLWTANRCWPSAPRSWTTSGPAGTQNILDLWASVHSNPAPVKPHPNSSHLGGLLVSLGADPQQPPEQEIGNLQLSEDLRQRSNSTQHLADHTVRAAQCWVDLGAHTCTNHCCFTLREDSVRTQVESDSPIRPPGAAYCRSLCSANNDTILEKMGLHISFPSWSLETIPGRTSISWPTLRSTKLLV